MATAFRREELIKFLCQRPPEEKIYATQELSRRAQLTLRQRGVRAYEADAVLATEIEMNHAIDLINTPGRVRTKNIKLYLF